MNAIVQTTPANTFGTFDRFLRQRLLQRLAGFGHGHLLVRDALGSQSFVPLGTQRFVVVVAAAGPAPKAADLQAFVTDGRQGIVLAPGTWHQALLAVEGGDFAVFERRADALDCRCEAISAPLQVSLPADLA